MLKATEKRSRRAVHAGTLPYLVSLSDCLWHPCRSAALVLWFYQAIVGLFSLASVPFLAPPTRRTPKVPSHASFQDLFLKLL